MDDDFDRIVLADEDFVSHSVDDILGPTAGTSSTGGHPGRRLSGSSSHRVRYLAPCNGYGNVAGSGGHRWRRIAESRQAFEEREWGVGSGEWGVGSGEWGVQFAVCGELTSVGAALAAMQPLWERL